LLSARSPTLEPQKQYAMPRGPQRQKRAATVVNIRAAE
jgi:hypothetical protein